MAELDPVAIHTEEQEMKDRREGVSIDNDVGSIINDNNVTTTSYSRTHIIVNTLYLPDVLFRRGNDYLYHLRNRLIRNLILEKVSLQVHSKEQSDTAAAASMSTSILKKKEKLKSKALILEIMNEIGETYNHQFLHWIKKKTAKTDYGHWDCRLLVTNSEDKLPYHRFKRKQLHTHASAIHPGSQNTETI